jgi:hypothetical protein
MEKITLRKENITKLINLIKEQDELQQEGNTVEVTPEELYKILPAIDYNFNALSKLKKFKDKDIIVKGTLYLRDKPARTLGPIKKIEGGLDMTNTQISSIEGVEITGRVDDWGSTRAKIREQRRIARLRAEAQSRREDGDWDIENADSQGLAANAIFQVLESEEPSDVQSEEDVEELRRLKERLGNLYYDQEQGNESEEVQNEIDSIEANIEEIEEKIDVYELIPSNYNFYGSLYRFDILSGNLEGREYAAGLESDAEQAAYEYAKETIDEVGIQSFNRSFWEEYLDEEGILDYFRDFYENDVRENPEIFFDEDDFELTTEQEERKEELENYIEDMENLKSELEDEQIGLEDSDSEEYYDLDEKIKEIESNIETAQNELDLIEPDTEPTEEMIERKVDDILDDVKYDLKGKLDEFGMDVGEWVDKDALAQGWVDSDGYGIMNSYDSSYETVRINGESYIVMRLN